MRLFLDHDVYAITAQFLKDLGHDVVTASESGHAQTDDSELLRIARNDDRLDRIQTTGYCTARRCGL